MDMLHITPTVAIPLDALTFTASRSSGPGGQHVNKVSTRVTLLFDVDGSPYLDASAKTRLRAQLGGRIGKDGFLQIAVQTSRSQTANKELAVERFVALLRAALTPAPPRRKTRATLASKLRRLETKKHRSTVKRQRTSRPSSED